MNIKIDKDYSIKSDDRNVILVKNRIVKEGKNQGEVQEDPVSYHGTLEGALKDYKRVKINSSEATAMNELFAAIKEIDRKIEEVLKGN